MASVASIGTDTDEPKDVKWTDARIRWPEDDVVDKNQPNSSCSDNDEDENPFDPFADSDPNEIFHFRFVTSRNESITSTNHIEEETTNNDDESIHLEIHGYKTDSDQVWESTGLTLWKASKYLCDYMVKHADKLRGQRILELGAGLGLNGILAHRLYADSVVITDGDSDAMVELRKNIAVNQIQNEKGSNNAEGHHTLSAAQLIWGLESSRAFLERTSQFSIIIASDVIYAAIVIDPLYATIQTLLEKPHGEFWMAFAVRKVPVTIEFVLEKAQEYGFQYELVDQQNDDNCDILDGVEGNPETGPVFIYVFRWVPDKVIEC